LIPDHDLDLEARAHLPVVVAAYMKLKQLGDLLKHEYPSRKGKLLGQRANSLHIREIGTNFQTVSVLSNQVRSYFSGGGNPR
jgi:hypothetical protein